MFVDEQVQKVLERYASFGAPPLVTLSPQEARQRPTIRDAVNALRQQRGETLAPETVASVHDEVIQGPEVPIGLRIYRPDAAGRLPMLVYFHGGGWVLGDLESSDATCRALTNLVRCLVISVNYRLAPEHPFPAAVQDAYAATQWVIEHAAQLGGDVTRLAVGGEDAGGNLAAVVGLMARDSQAHMPLYQVLIYPIMNHAFSTPSYEHNAYVRPLTRDEMRWFWGHYLPNPAAGANEYASPVRAEDFSDLPPGLIMTAEYDTVRDEGEAYGWYLEAAGVPMVLRRRQGLVHGFLDMAPVVKEAEQGLLEIASWLRLAFNPKLPSAGTQQRVAPREADVSAEALESLLGRASEPAEDEVVGNATLQEDASRRCGSLARPGSGSLSAPLETGIPVRVGMEVVGSDGHRMGKVKEVRSSDFVIDRRFRRDIALPFEAIHQAGDRVVLIVPAEEATKIDWPHLTQ